MPNTKTKTASKKTTEKKNAPRKKHEDLPEIHTHWFSEFCWGIWKVITDIFRALYRVVELILNFIIELLKLTFQAWFKITVGLGVLFAGIGAFFFFIFFGTGLKDSEVYQNYRDQNLHQFYKEAVLEWQDDATPYEKVSIERMMETPSVTQGEIMEILDTSCTQSSECQTPIEWAMQSNCPYTTQCMNGRCTVVCPEF